MKKLLLGAFSVGILFSPVISHSGTIGSTSITSYIDWEPDNCHKPFHPFFMVSDIASYNEAVFEFNFYLSQIESYISCIEDEANTDLTILKNVIADGLAESHSKALSELRSVRSELDFAKLYIK